MSREKEILEQSIEDHQAAIDSAKGKLKDLTEMYYCKGDRLKWAGQKYILTNTEDDMVCAVGLRSGNRWRKPIQVGDSERITKEEIGRIIGTFHSPYRYWDNKRRMYCE